MAAKNGNNHMTVVMSATADLNQKIILMNLDIMEETGSSLHHALDEYVDKVIEAGKLWTTSTQRNQSTFLGVYQMISKAMTFLSLKCDEIKCEHLSCLQSETPDLIVLDEPTQQQKYVLMDSRVDNIGDFSVAKPMTIHRESTEDCRDDVRNSYTCRELNLEIDQQTRYEYFYSQLKSVMAKQDGLNQQMDMKFNDFREEMKSFKSEVDQINTDLSDKVDEVDKELSEKVDEISTELSDKIDEINTELSGKVDEINTELSDKVDEINTELSDKVDEINTELSDKVNEINTELSDKVNEINTDLSDKVEQIFKDLSTNAGQINVVLGTLSKSQQEHAAQRNKIVALENHFNTVERGMQNNVKQVKQQLGEMGTNFTMLCALLVKRLAPLEKLRDILNERVKSQSENVRQLQAVTTEMKDISKSVEMCVRKLDVGLVGFNAKTILKTSAAAFSIVAPFDRPRFIVGCQFNSYIQGYSQRLWMEFIWRMLVFAFNKMVVLVCT